MTDLKNKFYFVLPYENKKNMEEKMHFSKKSKLEDVCSFFKNEKTYDFKLNKELEKKENNFYQPISTSMFKLDSGELIAICYYDKIDMDLWKKVAVRNLRKCVMDDDLSMGDKKLIKDIAIDSLYEHLNAMSDTKHSVKLSAGWSPATQFHESTRNELIR